MTTPRPGSAVRSFLPAKSTVLVHGNETSDIVSLNSQILANPATTEILTRARVKNETKTDKDGLGRASEASGYRANQPPIPATLRQTILVRSRSDTSLNSPWQAHDAEKSFGVCLVIRTAAFHTCNVGLVETVW